jgi:hypothetical protein
MATFVLVHEAWRGGWCYNRVAKRLRHAGHEVYTPGRVSFRNFSCVPWLNLSSKGGESIKRRSLLAIQ